MATRMQQRRGTAAQWTAANPILAAGEIGFETDTSKFKMGNGSSTWSALQYFANAADLALIIDGAPDLLNTLGELAESLGDNPNFLQALATNAKVDSLHLQSAAAITTASNGLTASLETHAGKTTSVHGIADTSLLATTENVATAKSEAIANAQTKAENAVIEAAAAADVKVAAAVAALTKSTVGLGNVDNTADTAKPVSLATEAAIDAAITEANSSADAKVSAHHTTTTSVHGIADTAELATKAYADNAVSTHQSDTTNVHGIADTSLLALKSEVAAVTKDTLGLTSVDNTADLEKPVSAAQELAIATAKSEAITSAGTAADTKISDHNLDTTNVHGIADTSVLVTQTDLTNAVNGATVDQSSLAGVGLDWNAGTDQFDVDSTHITTATQTELNLKAPKADPTFTGTVVLPSVTAGGSIIPSTDNTYDLGSPTKMWKDIYVGPGSLYVNGQKVIQDESGAIVVSADINENLGLRTSGSGNIELDPTGTGSVNIKGPLVVEAGANFSSADGEGIAFGSGIKSDAITSKTLNTDLSLSGNGTGKVYLNDNAEVNGNLVVGGNLVVSGTTTTVNSETISLADNIIDLNSNFTTGAPTENAGLRIMRGDSSAVQIRWNESTDKWEFTTDGTNYSVIAKTDSPTFTGTVTIPAGASISGYAPVASPTFTGTVTVAADGVAFTDGTQTKAGVPSITNIPTALAAGAVTIGASRADQFIPLDGAVVITLPATGYVTGQSIDFYQASSTGARFESTNGVVGTPGLKFRTTNSVVTAMKTSAGWLVFGDLSA